jgi:hypothetical protein
MPFDHPRMRREARTVTAMVRLYCDDHHPDAAGELCESCTTLVDYAHRRLQRCPFQARKPTCARCPIHCYQPEMREAMRAVMRYAGPRMLLRHPWLAIRHLIDGLRRTSPRQKGDRGDP